MPTTTNPPAVEIAEWDEVGDSYGAEDTAACLLSTIIIGGTWMHVEAIQVMHDENSIQQAADPALEDRFDEVNVAVDPGCWSTTEIDRYPGRQYVLFVCPFQD